MPSKFTSRRKLASQLESAPSADPETPSTSPPFRAVGPCPSSLPVQPVTLHSASNAHSGAFPSEESQPSPRPLPPRPPYSIGSGTPTSLSMQAARLCAPSSPVQPALPSTSQIPSSYASNRALLSSPPFSPECSPSPPLPSESPLSHSFSRQSRGFDELTESPDELTLRFMAMTLNDDGPDMQLEDNRTWMSRNEYQRQIWERDLPSDTHTEPQIEDIIDEISRLTLTPPSSIEPSSPAPLSFPTHSSPIVLSPPSADPVPLPNSSFPTESSPVVLSPPSADPLPLPVDPSLSSTDPTAQRLDPSNSPHLFPRSASPSPSQPPLTAMERAQRKRDCNNFTKRIVQVFKDLEIRVDAFSMELSGLTETPTRKEFVEMYSKLSNMQACLERNKRKSLVLDQKRAVLIQKLQSAHNCLNEIKLLLPEDENPVEYPIGMYCRVSVQL
jgi:hypothetical protein